MARRELTVKTHRGLFHARTGAKVRIQVTETKEEATGEISAFHFRWRKDEAFRAVFRIS
jgi:hypothetical protein